MGGFQASSPSFSAPSPLLPPPRLEAPEGRPGCLVPSLSHRGAELGMSTCVKAWNPAQQGSRTERKGATLV